MITIEHIIIRTLFTLDIRYLRLFHEYHDALHVMYKSVHREAEVEHVVTFAKFSEKKRPKYGDRLYREKWPLLFILPSLLFTDQSRENNHILYFLPWPVDSRDPVGPSLSLNVATDFVFPSAFIPFFIRLWLLVTSGTTFDHIIYISLFYGRRVP